MWISLMLPLLIPSVCVPHMCPLQRLKRLAHDYHHQLVVLPSIITSGTGGGQLNSLNSYKCLSDAVAASRPGDVIALKHGVHSLKEPVIIHHCLVSSACLRWGLLVEQH
jgi:hypothetical protein